MPEITTLGPVLVDIIEAEQGDNRLSISATKDNISITRVDNLQSELNSKAPTIHTHSNVGASPGFMTVEDKAKLDGIAVGATANGSNSTLLNRANHTGTQDISTINNLSSQLTSINTSIDNINDALEDLNVTVPYSSVALMLADTTPSRPTNTQLKVYQDGQTYNYSVAPVIATNNHLLTVGGVKLYALSVDGVHMVPEQLGYTDALTNWGVCAQIAWNAGYILKLGPKEYLTSTTAYLRSKTGVVGAGERVSGIKATAGFAGNIIDTENFATRVSGASIENDDVVPTGALYGNVLKDFYIDGNRPNVPAGTSTTGIGWRFYGRMMSVSDIHITNCASHGVQTSFANGNPSSFSSLNHMRIGFIDKLKVSECGREGWIFQGPGDVFVTNLAIGNNGRAIGTSYDPFNPTESLVFPGERCNGLVFDGVGGEFNGCHVWNHPHGWGISTRGGQHRVRLYNVISEGNWGQVDVSANCRMEFLGEIHDNAGGPKNSRIYYDGKNATAFAVGNTVTGGTSGATGSIIQVVAYTSTTGYIRVEFANQSAEEVLFIDDETITASGGATALVNRPIQVGSTPLWRDQSVYGTKAWIKHYQPSAGDGSTVFMIGGERGSYDIQSEVGSKAGCGHGVDLTGTNVMLTLVMEKRVRTAPDGILSTGLLVRNGALGANVRSIVRECNQNYSFLDDGADSIFNCQSLGAVTTHFANLATLDPNAYYNGRFLATASGSIVNSNKWQGINDTLDLTSTTAQTFTFTHTLGRTPGVSDFSTQICKIAGTTTMPTIERIHIESASSTQVEVIVKLGSGGVGTARLVCRSR